MSLLNASYALRASAFASGLPLNRKSGLRNAAPPYFHFIILQRHNVVICSLTVRSHVPVCFDKSALFVRIRPASSVIETSVKSSRNAAFRSLKFFTAVISNVCLLSRIRAVSRALRGRFSLEPFDGVQTSRRSAPNDFELSVPSSPRICPFPPRPAPPAPVFG